MLEPISISLALDDAELTPLLQNLPSDPAIFRLSAGDSRPLLSRTANLRWRMQRLLAPAAGPATKRLQLRGVAERLDYWPTPNRLRTWVTLYLAARQSFPKTYLDEIRLRMPPFVKLILTNRFPRTVVTSQVSRARALYFGPFRTRVNADRFENATLDLFQIRRCPDDLLPHPDHPGCIYGEMGKCLRPCQMRVSQAEYEAEAGRLAQFLETGGESLLAPLRTHRERASEELDFEKAASLHAEITVMEQTLRLRDELATTLDTEHGIAVVAGSEPGSVELWPLRRGLWHEPFVWTPDDDPKITTEQQLRERFAAHSMTPLEGTAPEHLAVLGRWYYSGLRDGEWIGSTDDSRWPWRRLANAIHRRLGTVEPSSLPASGTSTSEPGPYRTDPPTAFPASTR